MINLQEAVFGWFSPVLGPMWEDVSGKEFAKNMQPLERKSFLDLLCRAWVVCREECLSMCREFGRVPVEIFALVHRASFTGSVHLLGRYLKGGYDEYERMLVRALGIFLQLGEVHYTVDCQSFYPGKNFGSLRYPSVTTVSCDDGALAGKRA
jgi:hypothetical protein